MLNLQTPEDRSAAAGEYVLGTLAPDERETLVALLDKLVRGHAH